MSGDEVGRGPDTGRLRMLRGIASLLAGFLLLPLLMQLTLTAVLAAWPELDYPGRGSDLMTLNLALVALMAGISAAITARLAPEPRYLWVLLLAFVVFAGGLVFGIQQTGGEVPSWYLLGLPLISGLAIAAGGWAYLWFDRERA